MYGRLPQTTATHCNLPVPAIIMDHAVEGTTILSTSKQTMTIAIVLLGCYTRTYIDCLFNSFFPSFFPYSSHYVSCILTTFFIKRR